MVCGKSSEDQGEKLPGTIFSVAREVTVKSLSKFSISHMQAISFMMLFQAEELGVKALAVKCDVRKDEDVEALIASTMETFGRCAPPRQKCILF